MPIAATLSQALSTFGEEAAGAMVDWMQRVDSQRAELRELSDLSFSRIDARFAEADAKMDARFADMNAKTDARFAEMNTKMDAGFAETDLRFAEVSARIDLCRAELGGRIDAMGGRIDAMSAVLGEKLATRYGDILKRSFVFWATAMTALFLRTR